MLYQLSYSRILETLLAKCFELFSVVGEGFEPSKAEPPDLQSGPFDRSGIPPFYFGQETFHISDLLSS